MIVYSDFLMPSWMDGRCLGPIVQIRPSSRNDVGLVQHELVHQRQWKQNPILYPLRYWLSRRWRLRYELEAYREQLKHSPLDVDRFAYLLAGKYRLNISQQRAKDLLQKL